MEQLSGTILELHYQNEVFIRQNRGIELDLVKKENGLLLNLYSNLLNLLSRAYKKQNLRKGGEKKNE
jgi:hypothetical protein